MNLKKGNTTQPYRILPIACLALTINFLTTSCVSIGTYPATHRFVKEVTPADTSAIHNIEIFARLPYKYPEENMGVIVDVVIPEGVRYADTLLLPVKSGRFQYFGVNSGRWRDMKWSYRENIRFSSKGVWRLYIRRYPISPDSTRTGEIGFIINKL
ncbi:MAG: hypothetical protein AB9922_05855 [Bacteroidales bacterium]